MCLKCGTRHEAKAQECLVCGVVFEKYRPDASELEVLMPEGSRMKIMRLWQAVVDSYTDRATHETFIRACHEVQALPYASQKYARILAGSPNEAIAIEMRKRIIDLVSFPSEVSDIAPERELRVPKFLGMILFLSAAVIVLGFMMPMGQGLVGFGSAMIAIAYGLRKYLRPAV
jgi:hypothetical protein